jgi:hypothetical protein
MHPHDMSADREAARDVIPDACIDARAQVAGPPHQTITGPAHAAAAGVLRPSRIASVAGPDARTAGSIPRPVGLPWFLGPRTRAHLRASGSAPTKRGLGGRGQPGGAARLDSAQKGTGRA